MIAALAGSAPEARAQSVDPFTQQEQKLSGSDLIGFGWSVAMSADGTTALIGAPLYGKAWVYTRSGETWTQQGRPLDALGSYNFGMSVALSADGSTALVGDPGNSNGVGAVWVFTRSGQAWTQQGPKLTGSGEVGEGVFGFSVALSANGDTALVGAPADSGDAGAAWVFTRSGQTWTQQGSKLTGVGAVGAGKFGQSVALSANGNKALIGAPDDGASPGTTPGVGAAWVFIRSGQTWSQQPGS